MRLAASLALVALALSACGGSGPKPKQLSFEQATTTTTAAGTAHFTLSVTADLAGTKVTADENGAVSFTHRRAHLYKLVPNSGLPQEVIVDGPYVYTNGNVQAALSDPTVKPWTKLDTRRLTASQRARQLDEISHVLAPAYLAVGVSRPHRVGVADDGTTQFTGRVDPARLARRVPAAKRAAISAAVRSDYASRPFETSFWLDDRGRVRHVLVDYSTDKGTHFTIDATYTD
ncbi:MAG: hypothetical protein QOC92_86, partial [Acidimicrobiaceae bacterium]